MDPTSASVHDIASLLDFKCSDLVRSNLQSPFTEMEVKLALFSLSCNKMSGPDGYTTEISG